MTGAGATSRRATSLGARPRAVVLGLVLLGLVLAGCTGAPDDAPSPTPPAPPSTPSTPPAPTAAAPATQSQPRLWAVANEGGAAGRTRDGARDAATFDVFTAHAAAYEGQLPAMRAVNPEVTVLGYVNGVFVPPRTAGRYPTSYFALDAQGQRVRSRSFGNVLVDPRSSGWADDRVESCRRLVEDAGYDGCMLDVMGAAPVLPGYVTSPPVDGRTGERISESDWLQATTELAGRVKSALPGATIVVNGLDGGDRYFSDRASSAPLLTGTDGGVAEGWLRRADDPVTERPSLRRWEQDVALVEDAARRGRMVLVLPKAWSPGSEAEKAALHEFLLATYLLVATDSTSFGFSSGRDQDPTAVRPLDRVRLGPPLQPREVRRGVHVREFRDGLALVNPGDRSARVEVGRGWADEGAPAPATVTLAPHAGLVLERTTAR